MGELDKKYDGSSVSAFDLLLERRQFALLSSLIIVKMVGNCVAPSIAHASLLGGAVDFEREDEQILYLAI